MEKDPTKDESHKSTDDDEEETNATDSESQSSSVSNRDEAVEAKDDSEEKPASFFDDLYEVLESSESELVEKSGDEKETTDELLDEERLSEDEVHEAAIAIIEAKENDLGSELEEARDDSVEEFVALADAAFLESLRERAQAEDTFTPESIKEAYEEAKDDLSIDEGSSEIDDEREQEEDTDRDVSPPPPPVDPPESPPHTPDYPEDPRDPRRVASYSPVTTSAPVATAIPVPVPGPTRTETVYVEENRRGSDALVWAVVGYIVGRRGGRKRTEKRLNPKIDKLEAQVVILHDKIAQKEKEIRTLARESAEKEVKGTEEKSKLMIERKQKRVEIKKELKRREELAENPKVELVGKFSLPALEVFREKRLPDGRENDPMRKPVENMTVVELLDNIRDVRFENELIVRLYEAGRIDDDTLRQITKEYMRSGPYEKTLRRELKPDPVEIKQKRKSLESIHTSRATNSTQNVENPSTNNEILSQMTEGQKATDALERYRNKPQSSGKQVVTSAVIVGVVFCVVLLILYLV